MLRALLPVFFSLLAAGPAIAGAGFDPASQQFGSGSVHHPNRPEDVCTSGNPRDIVVCAQRRQGYRLDPDVQAAATQATGASSGTTPALPPAQALCASQRTGCGRGLAGLDLANVALVTTETAVRAARGEDWTSVFKNSAADEYQLYLAAKKEREARQAQRAAEAAKLRATQGR